MSPSKVLSIRIKNLSKDNQETWQGGRKQDEGKQGRNIEADCVSFYENRKNGVKINMDPPET